MIFAVLITDKMQNNILCDILCFGIKLLRIFYSGGLRVNFYLFKTLIQQLRSVQNLIITYCRRCGLLCTQGVFFQLLFSIR